MIVARALDDAATLTQISHGLSHILICADIHHYAQNEEFSSTLLSIGFCIE